MDVRIRSFGLKVLWAASLTLACQSVLAQVLYRMTAITVPYGCSAEPVANGFNASGEIAFTYCDGLGEVNAWLWKNNGSPAVDLGPRGTLTQAAAINTPGVVAGDGNGFGFISSGGPMTIINDSFAPGGPDFTVTDINDAGQVTGSADTPAPGSPHAFLWSNNGKPMVDLGTLGGTLSYGYAINGSGQIAGMANTPTASRAFIWKNDGSAMQNLGSLGGNHSAAVAINATGQVTGYSNLAPSKNTGDHAFFWRDNGTKMQDLGTLGGDSSYPVALNQAAQIAGWSNTQGTSMAHAFYWADDGMGMRDLGTLGGHRSKANDINPSGEVVGWATIAGDVPHAFLWRNDGTKTQDLNSLIDILDPLHPYITLTDARYINRRGDIVAKGTDNRTYRSGLYVLHGTVLTLSPRSLAFGNHPVNTVSAAKSVTMTNTSSKVAAIKSIALAGSASGQFGSSNDCGKSLAAHASCTIKVTFKPTTKGAKSATLNVNGGNGGLTAVSLTGTGN